MNPMLMLKTLTGQPLLYALKSPDTDLFDFGFGTWVSRTNREGISRQVSTHVIHAVCRISLRWKNGDTCDYDINTTAEQFAEEISPLLGCKVRQIWLSEKNDLRLVMEGAVLRLITYAEQEEQWRYFRMDQGPEQMHLVASAYEVGPYLTTEFDADQVMDAFWLWLGMTPRDYAQGEFATPDLEEYLFPRWQELMEYAKDRIRQNSADPKDINDILMLLAVDNEREELLDYIAETACDEMLGRLVTAGEAFPQANTRWQIAELLGRRKPQGWREALERLLKDEVEYVARRAYNALNK